MVSTIYREVKKRSIPAVPNVYQQYRSKPQQGLVGLLFSLPEVQFNLKDLAIFMSWYSHNLFIYCRHKCFVLVKKIDDSIAIKFYTITKVKHSK